VSALLKPERWRAALVGVDVVGEEKTDSWYDVFHCIATLDRALLGLGVEVNDVLVHRVLRGVHVRDEVADAALVVELDGLAPGALVDEGDAQARVRRRSRACAARASRWRARASP